MKKIILILIAIACFLPSCYYTDESMHELEIEIDSISEIDFFVNLDTLDNTFVVSDSLFFEYVLEIDSSDLYAVDLFFGEFWIGSFNQVTDSIWIAPSSTLNNGVYNISMFASYKTNTGSIADIYGVERKIVTRDWDINFTLNPFE